MKKIAILGSTGSIGAQTLAIIRRNPTLFKAEVLSAHTNAEFLIEQCRVFMPRLAILTDQNAYLKYKTAFPKGVEVACGQTALTRAASMSDIDVVVAAIVGMGAFEAVYAAVAYAKTIALANKEAVVSGGSVLMPLAKKTGANIIPVDSEHSAVWQCLKCGSSDLKRIILTASGGAFFGKTREELAGVTPEQAVINPNWSMGKKISVDSSTMMNKGLEIIEAGRLFNTLNVDYIIHPQSIVHSMIEYEDGSIIAQMSNPDMELPIKLALSYPSRLPSVTPRFDFSKSLTFLPPDEVNFPFPAIAKQALIKGGTATTVLNAANEAAVKLFLNNFISFTNIFDIVLNTLNRAVFITNPTKDDVLAAHDEVFNRVLLEYRSLL